VSRLAHSSDDDKSVLDKHGLASFTLSVNWSDDLTAHEERLQQAGFNDLHTHSSRGWPRSSDDPHAVKTPYSDPVYAVWGCKPEQ
jgi:hypothetical protein